MTSVISVTRDSAPFLSEPRCSLHSARHGRPPSPAPPVVCRPKHLRRFPSSHRCLTTLPTRHNPATRLFRNLPPKTTVRSAHFYRSRLTQRVQPGVHTRQEMYAFISASFALLIVFQVLKPYDLSYQARQNTQTYRKRSLVAPPSAVCRQRDVFHQLNIDPRTCTTNSVLLSQYVSEMGKVQGRHITGLTSKNQRLLGKTIRRAKQMGIMPTLYRATRN